MTHSEELDGSMTPLEQVMQIVGKGVQLVLAGEALNFIRREPIVAFETRVPTIEGCSNTKSAGAAARDDHAMVFQPVSAPEDLFPLRC
tara:strand:- start:219 stop:482 length:264 start_codon:yes stop_codon:yes gene_type:complete